MLHPIIIIVPIIPIFLQLFEYSLELGFNSEVAKPTNIPITKPFD